MKYRTDMLREFRDRNRFRTPEARKTDTISLFYKQKMKMYWRLRETYTTVSGSPVCEEPNSVLHTLMQKLQPEPDMEGVQKRVDELLNFLREEFGVEKVDATWQRTEALDLLGFRDV